MNVLNSFLTGGPISGSAAVASFPGSESLVILVGSDALYAWRSDSAALVKGFPVRGGNFFASRPLVTDLYGDGRPTIFAGCDDDFIYGFDAVGQPLPGFPAAAGGDVYSSPTAVDLDGDGTQEIVVGSDDGRLYVLKADGSYLPGWPQQTGGFVSASPRIVDLDGDGCQEILASSWDGFVYAWKSDGRLVPGWPQKTGHFNWSSPCTVDLYGDGRLAVFAASDKVYGWRADGSPLPGWPQETQSYIVGAPIAARTFGDECAIVAAADKVYAWNLRGESLPGFPLNLGAFFWAPPRIAGSVGAGEQRLLLCGWNGSIYAIDRCREIEVLPVSREPFFAAPTLADITGDGQEEILVGSWDGRLYLIEMGPGTKHNQTHQELFLPLPAGDHIKVREAQPLLIGFPGPGSSSDVMYYRPSIEEQWHAVPLVNLHGRSAGLIQPFPAGTTVSYWARIDGHRVPADGFFQFRVSPDLPGRLRRKFQKWIAAR